MEMVCEPSRYFLNTSASWRRQGVVGLEKDCPGMDGIEILLLWSFWKGENLIVQENSVEEYQVEHRSFLVDQACASGSPIRSRPQEIARHAPWWFLPLVEGLAVEFAIGERPHQP